MCPSSTKENIVDTKAVIQETETSTNQKEPLIEKSQMGKEDKPTTSTKSASFFERLSEAKKLMILTCFMFIFFGLHNIFQEAIMKIPGFEYGVMLGYFEVLGVTICSFLERRYIAKETGRVAPMSAYPALAFCLFASSSLSNLSLNFINFPTKVVFRSCKLIPTMVIATIINKQKFASSEYVAALSISFGLIMFAAADWQLSPSFHPFGLVLVSLSVCADAVLPNVQEKLFTIGASRLEVIFYTNIITLIAMTAFTLWSGDFMATMKMAAQNTKLLHYIILYTGVSYIAISTYMQIIKRFGGVVAVLIATARKGMTLILSFCLFPKAFSWLYVNGAILVLGGLLMSSLMKQKMKRQPQSRLLESSSTSGKKFDKEIDLEIARK